MLNPISINKVLCQTPDGFSIDQRRARITAALAIAVAQSSLIPGSAVESRRDYFYENLTEVRNMLFRINEVCVIDVDRICEIGYRIWSVRYDAAWAPFSVMLTSPVNPFLTVIKNNIADFESYQIDSAYIASLVELLRDSQ